MKLVQANYYWANEKGSRTNNNAKIQVQLKLCKRAKQKKIKFPAKTAFRFYS